MNSFDQDTWLNTPIEAKAEHSYGYGYERPVESRQVPLPHENFDPYYDSFSQVDDFLTETLTSLQDLDIPVGEDVNQNTYYEHTNNSNTTKGHKKRPSGTAIFGFAAHDKNLSIPGLNGAQNPENPPSIAPKLLEPSSIYAQRPPIAQQEPILFQAPQELEMAQRGYYPSHPYQQRNPTPPAPLMRGPPQAQLAPSVQVRPQQSKPHSSDYLVTSKVPSQYTFPPSPPRQHHQQHALPPKTVQVPVEYLQKLTSLIKTTEGIDMQKFLNYEFEHLQPPPNSVPQQQPSHQQHQHQHQHPQPPQQHQQPNVITKPTTPKGNSSQIITPQSQPQPLRYQPLPPPSQHQHEGYLQSSPVGLGIHYDNHHQFSAKDQHQHQHHHHHNHEEPESEFVLGPKTPSPTLISQARFNSSPIKGGQWIPIGGDAFTSMLKKKTQDKASTLPPGEIDQYITGPREDKTFICNFEDCGKLFTRRYNVRSHVQTHLSDRPFICDADGCNKAFVRQHDLTRHRKTHEEFAYKCPCGKKFSRQDALYRHRIRQICAGGIEEEDGAKNNHGVSTGSIKKSPSKKSTKPSIKIENDTVAKKLEADLLKIHKYKPKVPSPAKSKSSEPKTPPTNDVQKDTNNKFSDHDDNENVFLNDLNFEQFQPYDSAAASSEYIY